MPTLEGSLYRELPRIVEENRTAIADGITRYFDEYDRRNGQV